MIEPIPNGKYLMGLNVTVDFTGGAIGSACAMPFDVMVRNTVNDPYKKVLTGIDPKQSNLLCTIDSSDTVNLIYFVTCESFKFGVENHIMDRLPRNATTVNPAPGVYYSQVTPTNIKFYSEDFKGFDTFSIGHVLIYNKNTKQYDKLSEGLNGWVGWVKAQVDSVENDTLKFRLLEEILSEGDKELASAVCIARVLYGVVNRCTLGAAMTIVKDGKEWGKDVDLKTADQVKVFLSNVITKQVIDHMNEEFYDPSESDLLLIRLICGIPTADYIERVGRDSTQSFKFSHAIFNDEKLAVEVYGQMGENTKFMTVEEFLAISYPEKLEEQQFYNKYR